MEYIGFCVYDGSRFVWPLVISALSRSSLSGAPSAVSAASTPSAGIAGIEGMRYRASSVRNLPKSNTAAVACTQPLQLETRLPCWSVSRSVGVTCPAPACHLYQHKYLFFLVA